MKRVALATRYSTYAFECVRLRVGGSRLASWLRVKGADRAMEGPSLVPIYCCEVPCLIVLKL